MLKSAVEVYCFIFIIQSENTKESARGRILCTDPGIVTAIRRGYKKYEVKQEVQGS